MHRIDTTNSVVALPAPAAPGPGVAGYFQSAGGGGPPFTVLSADWANAVQEEIAGVVIAAGLALNKASQAQLLAAVRAVAASSTYLRGVGSGVDTQPGNPTLLRMRSSRVVINGIPLASPTQQSLAVANIDEDGFVIAPSAWYYLYLAKTTANTLYASPILSATAPDALNQRSSGPLNHTIGVTSTNFAAVDTLYMGSIFHVAAGTFRACRRIGSAVRYLDHVQVDERQNGMTAMPLFAAAASVDLVAINGMPSTAEAAHVNVICTGAAATMTVRVGTTIGSVSTSWVVACAAAGTTDGAGDSSGLLPSQVVSLGANVVPATYHWFMNVTGYEEPLL